MPGRLFLTRSGADLAQIAGTAGPPPDLAPRRNIAPGQDLDVIGPVGWTRARWGMIPVGRVNARGRPVLDTIINARSETVFEKSAFEGLGRAIVPADGWYEWTGAARRKTAWRIERRDGLPIFFAALFYDWTAPGGQHVPQVATVTCPPNGDVAPIHDRMGVLLAPEDIPLWLSGEPEAAALMRPLPDGQLSVGEATDVDWTAP